MRPNRRIAGIGELSAGADRKAIRQALGDTSPPVSSLLDLSTLGIAFYDDKFHCVVMNQALASLIGSPPGIHIGKSFHQSFGDEAAPVERDFQRAWDAGTSIHAVELNVTLPGRVEKTYFTLNLYPIRDNLGDLRLIGVLFYEVTNKKKLQERLTALTRKTESGEYEEDRLVAGESLELSMQSVEMLQQSIKLLDYSMAIRTQISEIWIIAALRRAAPFSHEHEDSQDFLASGPHASCPDASRTISPDLDAKGPNPARLPSHREQQVIQLLAEGNSNKEIAATLDLSIRTVEAYRASLKVKLHLRSVAELVRYALRNDLIKA